MENKQILRSDASSCKSKKGSIEGCVPNLNAIDRDGESVPLHKHQENLSAVNHQHP